MQLSLVVLVLSLATYRVTRFLLEDNLIDAQRWWLKKKVTASEIGMVTNDTPAWREKLADLMECPYCLSVWVAAAATLAAALTWDVPQPFWAWLAICGGCMIVWRVVEK